MKTRQVSNSKILTTALVFSFLFISCLKEDSLSPSGGTPPNFNQIPTGPGGISAAYSWSEIASFPGKARSEVVSFVLNGEGYVGLGEDYPNFFEDFYKYNPSTNIWTQLANFPDSGRRGAISFVINNTAYVGLGYGPDSIGSGFGEKNDFYKYDIVNDGWIRLNDFTAFGVENTVAFTVGNSGYIVSDRGEVFQYDPDGDMWTAKKELFDFDIESRESAVAFRLGSKVYYGTGYDDGARDPILRSRLRDFYEYTPNTDSWVEIDSLPGATRTNAVSFVMNGLGFIGTGNDFFNSHSDFYYYSAQAVQWVRVKDYPAGAGGGLTSFVINNVAYVGLGSLSNGLLSGGSSKKFYRFSS